MVKGIKGKTEWYNIFWCKKINIWQPKQNYIPLVIALEWE